jgi:hypothetical protein
MLQKLMTRTEARDMIARLCPSTKVPKLLDADLDDLADQAADKSSGTSLDPTDPLYSNRLLVYRSVGFGWELKMGYAASMVDVSDKVGDLSLGDFMKNCETMAALWAAKAKGALGGGSVSVGQLTSPDVKKLSNSC